MCKAKKDWVDIYINWFLGIIGSCIVVMIVTITIKSVLEMFHG